jgi:hypothetical protein
MEEWWSEFTLGWFGWIIFGGDMMRYEHESEKMNDSDGW